MELLADKWKARTTQALGKRRMGPHQIGVVTGKPQAEMRGEDSDRQPKCRREECWNHELEEGRYLQDAEIGLQ